MTDKGLPYAAECPLKSCRSRQPGLVDSIQKENARAAALPLLEAGRLLVQRDSESSWQASKFSWDEKSDFLFRLSRWACSGDHMSYRFRFAQNDHKPFLRRRPMSGLSACLLEPEFGVGVLGFRLTKREKVRVITVAGLRGAPEDQRGVGVVHGHARLRNARQSKPADSRKPRLLARATLAGVVGTQRPAPRSCSSALLSFANARDSIVRGGARFRGGPRRRWCSACGLSSGR